MKTVIVQFEVSGGTPTLAEAAAVLDVPADALEPGFGVVAVQPDQGLHAVLAVVDRLPRAGGPANVRIFSNPTIAAMDAGNPGEGSDDEA